MSLKQPHAITLLIVDDDTEFRQGLASFFRRKGYKTADAGSGEQALETTKAESFQVALIDMAMPGMSGIELLKVLREEAPETEVLLLTGEGTIERAVEAMKLGATDFLRKPSKMVDIEAAIERAAKTGRLRQENQQLRVAIQRAEPPRHKMIGNSQAMQEVFRLIERAGPSDNPILIEGESGTGKELVARALHRASLRSDKPLIVINCAALPEQLLESELFGHEKGAFTGAASAKPGLFEVADGGTLFIDEIGELAPALQPKLLRVLEDGSMRRIGSLKERRVDVRIIAATNRDMAKEVEGKRFREDLYYRINMMTIRIPPLRERGDDLTLLVDHFRGPGWEFEPAAIETMLAYRWPGNVRQLINAIERSKMLADDETLLKCHLPPELLAHKPAADTPTPPEVDLASLTRARVVQALQQSHGNKLRAAKALDISRRSLYRLIEKFHIERDEIDQSTISGST